MTQKRGPYSVRRKHRNKFPFPRIKNLPPYGYMSIVLRLVKGDTNQEIYEQICEDSVKLDFEDFLMHVDRAKEIVRDYIKRGRADELYNETYITNREMYRLINPPVKSKIKPDTKTIITPKQRHDILLLRRNGYGPNVIAKYLNIQDVETVDSTIAFAIGRGKIEDTKVCDIPLICYKTAKLEMSELLATKTNRTKKTAVTA